MFNIRDSLHSMLVSNGIRGCIVVDHGDVGVTFVVARGTFNSKKYQKLREAVAITKLKNNELLSLLQILLY